VLAKAGTEAVRQEPSRLPVRFARAVGQSVHVAGERGNSSQGFQFGVEQAIVRVAFVRDVH
jgi:hypothetical protein